MPLNIYLSFIIRKDESNELTINKNKFEKYLLIDIDQLNI